MSGAPTRVTLARVVRAEWTKLRALRSTWIVLVGSAVLVVGFAALFGWAVNKDLAADGPPPSPAGMFGGALLGIDILSLVIGVFGVLMMTGEYGTGLIRATLAAVPRRLPLLIAKAVVLIAAAAPVLLLACLAAVGAAKVFLGADGAWLDDEGVPRALLGAVVAPIATGLIGLGVGAMLRHTAGAITTLVVVAFFVPAMLPVALPERVADDLTPFVPTLAGQALYALPGADNPFTTFSPGVSALVLAGWVVAVLAGGAAVLLRRDA